MLSSALWLLIFSVVQETPKKPSGEYTLKFDMKFKSEASSHTKFETDEATGGLKRPRENMNLPYLILHLKVLTLSPEENRIRVLKGQEITLNKKIVINDEVKIDIGFLDDIKDGVIPATYTVLFLNYNKQVLSQILILFDEDGYYFVNGEKRGKI